MASSFVIFYFLHTKEGFILYSFHNTYSSLNKNTPTFQNTLSCQGTFPLFLKVIFVNFSFV